MSAPTLPSRPVIDVSDLPGSELDHRALIWWGNLMLLAIETTMFALLIAAYFYVRGNFHAWPPPQTNWVIARYNTNPALPLALINLAVIVLSCIPMAVADRMALCMRRMAGRHRLHELAVGAIVRLVERACVEDRPLRRRHVDPCRQAGKPKRQDDRPNPCVSVHRLSVKLRCSDIV